MFAWSAWIEAKKYRRDVFIAVLMSLAYLLYSNIVCLYHVFFFSVIRHIVICSVLKSLVILNCDKEDIKGLCFYWKCFY